MRAAALNSGGNSLCTAGVQALPSTRSIIRRLQQRMASACLEAMQEPRGRSCNAEQRDLLVCPVSTARCPNSRTLWACRGAAPPHNLGCRLGASRSGC